MHLESPEFATLSSVPLRKQVVAVVPEKVMSMELFMSSLNSDW